MYSGLPDGPGRFTHDSSSRVLLENPDQPAERMSTTGLTPSTVKDSTFFVYTPAPQLPRLVDLGHWASQPPSRNPYQVSHVMGLAPSAFARHYSPNHFCFLFLTVLRCFTSRRSPQTAYTFSGWSRTITVHGVSPFGHPGLNARLSAPPGFSQIPTSFIGTCCQGIHTCALKHLHPLHIAM